MWVIMVGFVAGFGLFLVWLVFTLQQEHRSGK
jgi:hypothetical protein